MKKLIATNFSYFATALFLALALTPLVRSLAFKINALDRGGRGHKTHLGAVPRLGGVAIFLSFILPFAFSLSRGRWDEFHIQISIVLAASLLVFFIGIYDDVKGATIMIRLGVECAAAFLVYSAGIRIDFLTNPFGQPLPLGWLSLPVTVLWIVILTNAFNLIDGLDGLAAGTGIMVAMTMVVLNLGRSDGHLIMTLVILIGGLLGFLMYNFPPASIFMGDSGSLFLGFFLSSLMILSTSKATAFAAMLVPVFAFAVPLLDMVYAVLRRWYRGMPLGSADREHIHHKLLEKGMGRRKTVLIFYAVYSMIFLALLVFIKSTINLSLPYLLLIVVAAVAGLRVLGYLRFSEFLKENYKHFFLTRKRRFFSYLIKRFRHDAASSRSWNEFRRHLKRLLDEFELQTAEIRLIRGGALYPVYYSGKPSSDRHVIHLEFPLLFGNVAIGTMTLQKKMSADYILCVSELVRALSTSLGGFLTAHPDWQNGIRSGMKNLVPIKRRKKS